VARGPDTGTVSTDLGEFLQSRRARLTPAEVGLPDYGGRRRVPGLRREELAQLAGVSADYYTRLEQGRGQHVSDAVLEAVATALRLDTDERAHLRALARPPRRRARPAAPPRPQRVAPGLRRLLEAMDGVPAFVLGRRMDVLAWNRLAAAVGPDWSTLPAADRNVPRALFLDEPASRALYPDWAAVAAETVGYLRMDAGRHPDDPAVAALVGELSVRSPEFARRWGEHPVREKTRGVKRIAHPLVGPLRLHYETLRLPDDPDQLLVTYTGADERSVTGLRLLASLA
jgi:transcriptional regulator with XRE-family HTH domain